MDKPLLGPLLAVQALCDLHLFGSLVGVGSAGAALYFGCKHRACSKLRGKVDSRRLDDTGL